MMWYRHAGPVSEGAPRMAPGERARPWLIPSTLFSCERQAFERGPRAEGFSRAAAAHAAARRPTGSGGLRRARRALLQADRGPPRDGTVGSPRCPALLRP